MTINVVNHSLHKTLVSSSSVNYEVKCNIYTLHSSISNIIIIYQSQKTCKILHFYRYKKPSLTGSIGVPSWWEMLIIVLNDIWAFGGCLPRMLTMLSNAGTWSVYWKQKCGANLPQKSYQWKSLCKKKRYSEVIVR